jgi:hypothetical protein
MARGFLVAIFCGLLLTASGVASPRKSPTVSLLTRPSVLVAGTGVRGNTGDGGPATGARLDEPFDVVPTASGALFILESGATGRIRRIAPSGTISTLTRR